VTLQLPGGYSYRIDNIPETAAQVDQNGPAQPSAIAVTTSSSSQYRITISADGGAVTIN
jgi:VCBS repeat-containing protein